MGARVETKGGRKLYICAAGRVLLPVPYWEWDALGSNLAAKQEYLRAALQQVLPEAEAQSLAAAKTCN